MEAADLITLLDHIKAKLAIDDDKTFWEVALHFLTDEFVRRHSEESGNRDWVMVVGKSSHWVRPHNSTWGSPSGTFVFPEGYMDSLPELDWYLVFAFRDRQWLHVAKPPDKKLKTFRAAIPSRTARHSQAVVHTQWSPGSKTVFFGFRKLAGVWQCVAISDG